MLRRIFWAFLTIRQTYVELLFMSVYIVHGELNGTKELLLLRFKMCSKESGWKDKRCL